MACRADAGWDEVARAWIATSGDVPGLCAEAEGLGALIEVVLELVPDLLVANGVAEGTALDGVPIRAVAKDVAVAWRDDGVRKPRE